MKNYDKKAIPSHFTIFANRANQQKHLIKGLKLYYSQLQSQWLTTSKDVEKLAESLPIPFHESDQFLANGQPQGWQTALAAMRERTRSVAGIYVELAGQVDRAVLVPLETARQEVKTYLSKLDSDLGKLTNDVDQYVSLALLTSSD